MSVELVGLWSIPKGWKPVVSSYIKREELDIATPAAIAVEWAESLCIERGYDPEATHRFGFHVRERLCVRPYSTETDGATVGLYLL